MHIHICLHIDTCVYVYIYICIYNDVPCGLVRWGGGELDSEGKDDEIILFFWRWGRLFLISSITLIFPTCLLIRPSRCHQSGATVFDSLPLLYSEVTVFDSSFFKDGTSRKRMAEKAKGPKIQTCQNTCPNTQNTAETRNQISRFCSTVIQWRLLSNGTNAPRRIWARRSRKLQVCGNYVPDWEGGTDLYFFNLRVFIKE